MDTTAATSKLAESNSGDQFIPVRKEDLLSALTDRAQRTRKTPKKFTFYRVC